jgi:hypothetical protein
MQLNPIKGAGSVSGIGNEALSGGLERTAAKTAISLT